MRIAPPIQWLKRSAAAAALSVAAVSGLVSAQPAPPVTPPDEPVPISPVPAPGAPVTEEAPPVNVAPPAPIVAPPLTEKEVSAAPPKAETVEKAPEAPPIRRARSNVAILQAIDKVTAESLRFEAAVGRPVRFKNLVFTVRACERSAPDEAIEDSVAYLTIDSQPRPAPGKATPPPRQAFKGWMYASSPGLNPLEHAVYDAWLISCRTSAPLVAPAARPVTLGAAPATKAPAARPVAVAAAPAAKAPPAKAPRAKAPAATAPVAKAPAPKAAPVVEPAPAAAPEPKL